MFRIPLRPCIGLSSALETSSGLICPSKGEYKGKGLPGGLFLGGNVLKGLSGHGLNYFHPREKIRVKGYLEGYSKG